MNPKHVTNLELSKQLFEAGITKDFESEFYWVHAEGFDPEWQLMSLKELDYSGKETKGTSWRDLDDYYSALLLDELLELMPEEVYGARPRLLKGPTCYYADYEWDEFNWGDSEGKIPLEALSSLASYLLREGKFNNNAK